jgi:hypothetical protein
MVVNFRARGISRGALKLARTPTLIKRKKPKSKLNFSIFNPFFSLLDPHTHLIKEQNQKKI